MTVELEVASAYASVWARRENDKEVMSRLATLLNKSKHVLYSKHEVDGRTIIRARRRRLTVSELFAELTTDLNGQPTPVDRLPTNYIFFNEGGAPKLAYDVLGFYVLIIGIDWLKQMYPEEWAEYVPVLTVRRLQGHSLMYTVERFTHDVALYWAQAIAAKALKELQEKLVKC